MTAIFPVAQTSNVQPPVSNFRWNLLDAGPLSLDGGGMFGLVPRVVWGRSVQTDERHRIRLNHNAILLQHPQGPVVIETGSGDKLDAKNRDIFGLSDRSIIPAVEDAGTRLADVKHAIVTHLHFDHAGGLTRRTEDPDRPALTFPNATVHAQRREWEDALTNRSVMTRTYFRDHLDPIRECVKLHESPPPFEPGQTPDRGAFPAAPLEDRLTEVIPGVFVFSVPGHTWGQQAILFRDDANRTVVFVPDVMPTAMHVGAAYSLAYDVEPYISMISKQWLLAEAARRDWTLVLDHEPHAPVVRVREDGKGWYRLEPVNLA
jgi:glyoxylase-like metal-dependent hydrolase (beta-lactamase superfamily II)